MIHFDEVLPTAREVLAKAPALEHVEHVLVLRDLRGRIRLFLQPVKGHEDDVQRACAQLAADLAHALSGFWGELIELDSPQTDTHALLETVRAEAVPLSEEGFAHWSIIERHVSKSAWTRCGVEPPWPLLREAPGIVSFFSHKGGVGRTTALCAVALNLARAGRKVVVIDLDIEAPGLGPLLPETPVECGVVDYLLEFLVTEAAFSPRIDDYVAVQTDSALIGPGGEPIPCVPAGCVDAAYLEKLGRLDYELMTGAGVSDRSPFQGLFKQLRAAYQPEYILLDCRCGLHDLGGLAVQCLSHLSVIFGLDSEASWQGLRLIVQRLRQSGSSSRCLLVQAMEPPPGEIRRQAREQFLSNAYNAFLDEFYLEPQYETAPDLGDRDAPHYPMPIAHDPALAGYQTLADVAEILTRDPYAALTQRIASILGRPT